MLRRGGWQGCGEYTPLTSSDMSARLRRMGTGAAGELSHSACTSRLHEEDQGVVRQAAPTTADTIAAEVLQEDVRIAAQAEVDRQRGQPSYDAAVRVKPDALRLELLLASP